MRQEHLDLGRAPIARVALVLEQEPKTLGANQAKYKTPFGVSNWRGNMGTVLTIIAVAAVIGALLGFLGGGGKSEDAVAGATVGAIWASGCMFQLLIYGLMALAGLWIVKVIFL